MEVTMTERGWAGHFICANHLFLTSQGIKSGVPSPRKRENPKWRPITDLYISNMFCIEKFLLNILDFSIVKKDSIMETLERLELKFICVG